METNSVPYKINLIKSIVKRKKVVLIGNSPTVDFFVNHREAFRNKNFVYGSLSHWVPIEEDFLNPIGEKFQILFAASPKNIDRHRGKTKKFTYRKNSVLITERKRITGRKGNIRDFNLPNLFDINLGETVIDKKRKKPWARSFPNKKEFNIHTMHSIILLLAIVVFGRPKSIYVFGCDGGLTKDYADSDYRDKKRGIGKCHYKCDRNCVNKKMHRYPRQIRWDVKILRHLKIHMKEVFNIKFPPIYIAGIHSKYRFGEKVSKEDFLKLISK